MPWPVHAASPPVTLRHPASSAIGSQPPETWAVYVHSAAMLHALSGLWSVSSSAGQTLKLAAAHASLCAGVCWHEFPPPCPVQLPGLPSNETLRHPAESSTGSHVSGDPSAPASVQAHLEPPPTLVHVVSKPFSSTLRQPNESDVGSQASATSRVYTQSVLGSHTSSTVRDAGVCLHCGVPSGAGVPWPVHVTGLVSRATDRQPAGSPASRQVCRVPSRLTGHD